MQLKRGTYREYLFRKYLERTWNNLKRIWRYGTLDMFIAVNIETTTECNLSCDYCPVSRYPNPNTRMNINTFIKTIKSLKDMGFKGIVHLHNYGEPLLDIRLPYLCRLVRIYLPKCKIVLFTNGTLPVPENVFDRVEINQFDRGYIMYNRGGLVDLPGSQPMGKCKIHLDCLIVNVDGDVVLCCNDYFSTVTYGNVNDMSIKEIWDSPKYRDDRQRIARGEKIYPICKQCKYKEIT